MLAVRNAEDKVLDVLGMTLYTAWPSLRFLLTRPEMSGWKVRFAGFGGPGEAPSAVPPSWREESATNLNSIMEASVSGTLRRNNVTIEAYGYLFAPAIHGFGLRTGEVFYSILLWDEATSKLCLDGYSYEFVAGEDHSASAEAVRRVFSSWFSQATAHPWELARKTS